MNPLVVIALINAAIDAIDKGLPLVEGWVSSGEVTAEAQQALLDRIAKLRPGGTGFSGPEWTLE